MKVPLVTSGALHLAIFVVVTMGLPFAAQKPLEQITAINVELVDIGDITQTTRLAEPVKKPEEPKEEKPPEARKPKPKPEELKEPEPPKIEKPAEKPPEPVEKPKPKPKPPEKKPKLELKTNDFESLLNNIAPDLEEAAPEKPEELPSQIASLGDRITISERDAIGQQLYPCWNVPAGAKYAENLVIEIRVFMNVDGSIRDTQILDRGRYAGDSHFRAAADSADRALRNPRCTPLKYPPEKYEQLKQFVFRFDPRDML